ncbi:MAG: hypothetical protein IJD79_03790 [Clostridia bacterium]|nr:hypothetical protein [Clostridia bacterium]
MVKLTRAFICKLARNLCILYHFRNVALDLFGYLVVFKKIIDKYDKASNRDLAFLIL